jgi:membrane associated rhomboid family serine protease
MFFPISCDAVLYYLPYCTGGLIVVNVLVFAAAMSGSFDPADGWLLEFGTGLHPVEWLLSVFMHASIGHLVGNMFFLWTFGLVTEGKLGWWKFLLAYLGIGVAHSALAQAVVPYLNSDVEYALGASAAIYGLMAMAVVWAPMNSVSVFIFFGFRFFIQEVMLGILAILYVSLDVLYCLLWGTGALGSVGHLTGGVMGLVLGIVLLKTGQVECEDNDLLSVISGTYGDDKRKLREAKQYSPERMAAHQAEKTLEESRRFQAYLQIDQPEQALAVKRKATHLGNPLPLERADVWRLIAGLHKKKLWVESAPVMAEFLERFPEGAELVRLKLAQICLVELDKPGRAMELLEGLEAEKLTAEQRGLAAKIRAAARRKVEEGALEVDDGAWG